MASREINLATIARLLGVMDVVSVPSGEFLFREGDDAHALYIVRSGVLQIMGADAIYETVTVGGVVGELAMADEGTPSASVLASNDAELWAIDRPGFLALVNADPEFAFAIMRIMAQRLRAMNRAAERRPSVRSRQPKPA
jgi:NTE family protein